MENMIESAAKTASREPIWRLSKSGTIEISCGFYQREAFAEAVPSLFSKGLAAIRKLF